ncbi:hypothetical protein NEF87_004420 [Candidatus Lokiarchaeum ossiferum]|uniref:TIGR04255 family protein n=1 Tax=Candidatus Lokiarchaeum ossiferum TaxID=2951803 RepID=A0ABY6HX96_9ARCH|nr:hypothetical protein NEF87_004420 [Candidatus Lokiarchaeum sp. B-35]
MTKLKYPRLDKFVLRISYNKIEEPTIQKVTKISEKLGDLGYPEPTTIRLISSRVMEQQISFSPLTFKSESKDNAILIYSDSILFEYNDKYTSWHEIFPKILQISQMIFNDLKIKDIIRISLDYIDIFTFDRENFRLNENFEMKLKHPNDYMIGFEDFIIGLNFKTDIEGATSILRLRGVTPKNEDEYTIRLETHFNINENLKYPEEFESIKKNLDIAHQKLILLFKDFLTEKTKSMVGLFDDS